MDNCVAGMVGGCDKPQGRCLCSYCTKHCQEYCHGGAGCACREKKVEGIPLAQTTARTTMADLLDALMAVDQCLEENEPKHQGAWRRQVVAEHLEHAAVHVADAMKHGRSAEVRADLVSAATRMLFALQLWEEKT